MRRVVAGLLFTVVACSVSHAQNSEEYGRCTHQAHTQLAMHVCAKEEALRVDAELNGTYQELLSAVGNQAAAMEKIRAAEKAWIAYRDSYTDAMFSAKNKQGAYGSMFPMAVDLLRAKLTRQQIAALKDLLKQYGGSTQ
jgi:uncharacterized protein YecT (DUF1311 family)